MKTAVLVLTWNAADRAVECLASLHRQHRSVDYLLVVDNASCDQTVPQIEQVWPELSIIRNSSNLGFAGGMNVGIQALQSLTELPDVVILLNQDTSVEPAWLQEMLRPFDNLQVGAVGCKIRYADGTIQHAGAYLEWPRAIAQHVGWHEPDTGQYDTIQTYDIVTGAAVALRMQALNQVGLFDPGYAPAYYEDTDLCWRLRRQQYQIVYTPGAVVTHYESLSIPDAVTRSRYYNRGRIRFVLKTYSLADILGVFAESEQAFIAEHGHTQEARALRWAYTATLLHLPEILHARQAFYPVTSSDEVTAIVQMILAFKQAVSTTLYRRTRTLSDRIRYE
jgi:GT2 family glycosyltransferase